MRPILTALLVPLLVACSAPITPFPSASDEPPPAEPHLVIVDGDAGADGITVAEALDHGPTDDIVAVTGVLFVTADGNAVLCDMILESFPPQCGGASLLVEGLDLSTIDLEEANGVRWAESVTLLGSVE